MPARSPSPRLRIWLLFAYWMAMFLVTHLPGIEQWRPRSGWPIRDPDKLVHLLAYAGWAVMWVWMLAAHGRPLNAPAAALLLIGGALFGAFDEVTQELVGRSPDFGDWILDLAGLILGLLVARLWQTRYTRRQPRHT